MNPDKCSHGGRVGAHRWREDKSRDTRQCIDCGRVETQADPSMFNPNIYSADISASMKKITDGLASTAKNLADTASAAETTASYATMLDRLGLTMGGTANGRSGIKYDPDPFTGRKVYVPPDPTSTTVYGNPEPGTRVGTWTSEDALTLILEEIKHDPDPFTAAGKWLTRFTNGVTAITRNLDEED